MKLPLVLAAASIGVAAVLASAAPATPIRVHPANPRYFEWRGQARALIAGAEHYGAVLNADFDFRRYLEALARDGLNYTRVFAGSYVEPAGAFGIERNTLAPGPGRFLAPWARSDQPGYAGGGARFDLDRWDPAYLARMKDFLGEAGRRGIVVELTLFCSTYGERQWALSPFHPGNQVNGLTFTNWPALHTLAHGAVFARQEALVRYLARELNGFDNLFYEIQNEPWADNHVLGDLLNPYLPKQSAWPNAVEITTPASVAWQAAIARALMDEESRLPRRHLLAQNIANFRLPIGPADLAPGIGLVNFHYAYPEAATWNLGLTQVIGCDETGFAGRADVTYRRQAWSLLFAGGGLFNHLDYSFSVGHEDGSDAQPGSPGGGSAALRRQLGVLSRFLHRFDLASLSPDPAFVRRAPGAVARTLSAPGHAYGVYVQARGDAPLELRVNLPRGHWRVEWMDAITGEVARTERLGHGGGPRTLAGPDAATELAVRLEREGAGLVPEADPPR